MFDSLQLLIIYFKVSLLTVKIFLFFFTEIVTSNLFHRFWVRKGCWIAPISLKHYLNTATGKILDILVHMYIIVRYIMCNVQNTTRSQTPIQFFQRRCLLYLWILQSKDASTLPHAVSLYYIPVFPPVYTKGSCYIALNALYGEGFKNTTRVIYSLNEPLISIIDTTFALHIYTKQNEPFVCTVQTIKKGSTAQN